MGTVCAHLKFPKMDATHFTESRIMVLCSRPPRVLWETTRGESFEFRFGFSNMTLSA